MEAKKKKMAVLAEFSIFKNPSWASGAKNYVIIIIGTLPGNSILFLNRYIIPQKDLGLVVLCLSKGMFACSKYIYVNYEQGNTWTQNTFT